MINNAQSAWLQKEARQALQHLLGFDPQFGYPIVIEGRAPWFVPPWLNPADYTFDGTDGVEFLREDEVPYPVVSEGRLWMKRPRLQLPEGAPREVPPSFAPRIGWYDLRSLRQLLRQAFPRTPIVETASSSAQTLLEARDAILLDLEAYFAESPGLARHAQRDRKVQRWSNDARLLNTVLELRRQRRLEWDDDHLGYDERASDTGVILPAALAQLLERRPKRGRPPSTGLVVDAIRTLIPDVTAKEVAMIVALEAPNLAPFGTPALTAYFSDKTGAQTAWSGLLARRRSATAGLVQPEVQGSEPGAADAFEAVIVEVA